MPADDLMLVTLEEAENRIPTSGPTLVLDPRVGFVRCSFGPLLGAPWCPVGVDMDETGAWGPATIMQPGQVVYIIGI